MKRRDTGDPCHADGSAISAAEVAQISAGLHHDIPSHAQTGLGRDARPGHPRQNQVLVEHTRRRGLLARLLPVRRTTFVIDTDRTVLNVVSSELRASVHADQTLSFLQNHNVPHSSPDVRGTRTDARQQSEGKGAPINDLFAEPETADEPSLVRPYALTAGHTDSGVELPPDAPVEALNTTARPPRWPRNDVRGQILTCCVPDSRSQRSPLNSP